MEKRRSLHLELRNNERFIVKDLHLNTKDGSFTFHIIFMISQKVRELFSNQIICSVNRIFNQNHVFL